MSAQVEIVAVIEGRQIPRSAMLEWEDSRITASARKLGIGVSTRADTATRREELVAAKMDLGADRLIERWGAQLAIADITARTAGLVIRGRAFVTAELDVTGGSSARMVEWFAESLAADDRAAMLRACPDHYVLRTCVDGRQEVVQATGASPMVNRFFLDYDSEEGLANPAEPRFTHHITASARLLDGTLVGGARMQFCDTPDGFYARLIEEFPRATPGFMIRQQRRHTALEFSNWAEAAHAD